MCIEINGMVYIVLFCHAGETASIVSQNPRFYHIMSVSTRGGTKENSQLLNTMIYKVKSNIFSQIPLHMEAFYYNCVTIMLELT